MSTTRRLASAITAAAAVAVLAVPTSGQTFVDPWENTPDFTGAWEMGDVFVGVGAPSWWPGMNPGEWVILREESDLLAHPLGYSIPGIAVRDTADVARGFLDDPAVEGFAAACTVDPVTGNLWTADSFGFVTQFSGAPTVPSPPTVRDIVSRITSADFVPPGGPAAPNALAIDGTGPGRRLWLGTYDYFGDFWDDDDDVAGALLGFDLPHVQGNPLSVTGFHQPPVSNGGIYKMDFASDGETMVYTSFDKQVLVYNVNDPTVVQPFGPPLPVLGVNDYVFDVRVLPPGNYDPVQNTLEGGMLVATYSRIYRLDQDGNMIQAYEPGTGDAAPGGTPDFWYLGVIVSADGQSFWSATYTDGVSKNGYLYKVNIATGMVELGPINLGLDGAWSLCVKGEFRAAVSVVNQTPSANAGPDQPAVEATGPTGAPVTLDGSLSADPNPLDTLSYTWTGTFPEGGGTVTGASPVVTLALGGPHTASLAVADPWGATDSDTVTVTVQDTTSPLLTLATTSIAVDPTTPTGAPVDVLAAAGASATDVVDPSPVLSEDGPAEFPTGSTTQVTITATDARGNAISQTFTVTVRNQTPTAEAGPDQPAVEATGASGAPVTLDGSASSDPDPLDTLTYTWTGPFPEGGGTVTGVSPVVTLALGGPHTVTLTVSDPWGGTHSDTVAVTVQDTTAPQLTLTATSIDVDPTTSTGAVVDVLAVAGASASDVADPSPALSHDGTAEFPTAATTLVTITATDASGNATSQQFSVTVRNAAPTANTGPDQPTVEATGASGAPVTLDGSASTDPDPFDTLSYTWTGPFSEGGGTVTGESPVVTLALGGPHAVTLTVTDPWGETDSDTVAITVQDTTAPQLTLTTTSIAVDPTTPTGAPVDVLAASGASATDVVDSNPALSHDAPAEFPTRRRQWSRSRRPTPAGTRRRSSSA